MSERRKQIESEAEKHANHPGWIMSFAERRIFEKGIIHGAEFADANPPKLSPEERESLLDEAVKALESAKELQQEMCAHIARCDYDLSEGGKSVDEVDLRRPLFDGTLRAYEMQFDETLAKIKKSKGQTK